MDFFIIGAQKSGTTSIYEYLKKHEGIFLAPNKETEFFSNDDYYGRGESAYHAYFAARDINQICGDVSPQYMYTEGAAHRIYKFNPSSKIIAILREPVSRMVSHYRMLKRRGQDIFDIETVVEQYCNNEVDGQKECFSVIENSLYGKQLSPYFKLFEKKNILVLTTSELENAPLTVVRKIEKFLGLEHRLTELDVSKKHHQGGVQRFPRIYNAYLMLQTLPAPIKKLIKSLVGAKRLSSFAYKWETQYSVKRDSKTLVTERLRSQVKDLFNNDRMLLEKLTGEKWDL